MMTNSNLWKYMKLQYVIDIEKTINMEIIMYEKVYAGLKNAKQIDRVAPFYAMVENIDTNMGRLLRTIDSLGLADNTLIVFSTDNGSAAGSSFYNAEMHGSKGSPYRGGTRVPAFWKWKGVLPALRAAITACDVAITLRL